MTKISVVIPFYNESENIPGLCSYLQKFLSEKKINAEIIFVDDGSTDNSVELIKQSKNISFNTKVVKLSKNFGSHAALRAGIINSSGDYITFLYADLQDPPELINEMLMKCIAGYEIVWATREAQDNFYLEKVSSKLYAKLMQLYAVKNFPLRGFDIVMFTRKVQKEINYNIEANSSIFLQILNLGYKQASISYNKNSRMVGKSKWTLKKKMKLFIDSFVAFSYAPIRLVTILGLIFSGCGFLYALYLFLRTIFHGDLTPGWPALIAILMIGFGVTNISLGIIAEYLWRTLDASRNRKVFIIDEIIDLKNELDVR